MRQERGTDDPLLQLEHRGQLGEFERRVAAHHRPFHDRVGIHRDHAAHAFVGRIDGQRTAAEQVAEAPQVVHAGHVIGVTMGEDEEIQPVNPMAQALLAELLGGIDLDVQAVHDHVNAAARALVARIGGGADRAPARDHRHPLRGARTQDDHFHGGQAKQGRRLNGSERIASGPHLLALSLVGLCRY